VILLEFETAVQHRFALIDVKKNLRDSKKESKKGKEPMLDLYNKIKIITLMDETFNLWSQFISKYSQGELLDPNFFIPQKMKEKPNWVPHKDGILNRVNRVAHGVLPPYT